MLGLVALVSIVTLPGLLAKKCAECGVRNGLDATACKGCAHPFPDD